MDKEEIFREIESYGADGIKKKDLKERLGKEVDGLLNDMSSDERIIVDKKGNAYYVWSKNNYLNFISKKHPKVLDILQGGVTNNIQDRKMSSTNAQELEQSNSQESQLAPTLEIANEQLLDYEEFEQYFKKNISRWANSLGWAPLAKVRETMCKTINITAQSFYEAVGEITQQNCNRYELSTGGNEGIQLRGMIHGFVRCV